MLLEGFYYNITFCNFYNEIEHNVSGFFKVKESEYDIESQSLILEQFEKIGLEFYEYFNFSSCFSSSSDGFWFPPNPPKSNIDT